MQNITQADMDSAARGLNMDKMGLEELTDLASHYKDSPDFAGQVIRKATLAIMTRKAR